MELLAAAHDGSEWRVITHARVDQNNNVTLYDSACITAGPAQTAPSAYTKRSECVAADVPTTGALVIAPNRP